MKPTGRLSDFAARLRRLIHDSTRPMPPQARTPLHAECETRPGPWRACLTDTGFNSLALELFGLQFEHNEPYRRICMARRASPEDAPDWSRIPAAPAAAFKDLELSCLPPEERAAVFYSSGTTGQRRSRHFHNDQSLALYRASLTPWFEANVMDCGCGIDEWQLAILAPAPQQAPHSSLVHMFETVRRKLGSPASAFLGLAAADGGWSLDPEAATAALQSSIRSARPLLLLGAAFMFVRLLDHLAEQGLQLELPPRSRAMETGGYKGRSRALPADELRALITRRLGIPPARIIREYGMSELSSQAYAGPPGSSRPFRFPAWARVQVISPETGQEVAEGKTGLIRVFDLANVFSVLAIQTEDLAVRRADGFELLGRAALAEPRGCSLMASQS
ncbi:MAG: long-chain fatty acid--CoA ligase [Limisphaerales bacterium]